MLSVLWRRWNRCRGVLQIEGGPEEGKEVSVRHLPLTIGRGDEADLPLADRWVSRRHCEIFERDGALALRDLGSRHGTLVNGCNVAEALLRPGDRICVGMTTLVACYELPGNG
jgi:pSer/pThr/pTyr-binding forkhead associated (FHA) protein